eukprot:scaffold3577_cov60-Attheya_sp.AAC.1
MHVRNSIPVFAAICCLASSSEGLGVASFSGHASSLLLSKIPRGGGGTPKLKTASTDAPQDGADDTPILTKSKFTNVVTESLSGTTVALTSIPASIAFATIAGVDPLVGIWSSVVLGAVSSIAGLRAGLVAGAAGVVAVPLGKIVRSSGVKYMGPTILLASLMELIFGLAKGGRLINLVSDPVMTGFLNGLGCLLLKSQLDIFRAVDGVGLLPRPELMATGGITALTAVLTIFLPKLLPGNGWPCSLMAIVASTVLARVMHLPISTLTIGSSSTGGVDQSWYSSLPSFVGLTGGDSSLLTVKTLQLVAPAAFSIAVISILETLLAVKVVDDAVGTTDETTDDADAVKNKSLMAMSAGNALSALFGGFGGCGLIPQTFLNLQSGGTGVTSVLVYTAVMALSVLFFAPLIGMIPYASLAGVMGVVAFNTIQWKPTIKSITRANKGVKFLGSPINKISIDLMALVAASLICFKVDMGTGIIVGIMIEKILPTLLLK